MLNGTIFGVSGEIGRRVGMAVAVGVVTAGAWSAGLAQATKVAAVEKPHEVYTPIPGFDTTSIDTGVNPCNDFYKFACGKFAANHPIPADQPEVDQFYALYNVNTQSLNGILNKAAAGGRDGRRMSRRSATTTRLHGHGRDQCQGACPVEPLLEEIDARDGQGQLPALIGKLQRTASMCSSAMASSRTSRTRASRSPLSIQGGLGLPEKDYYLRTGAKDETIREQYVAHVAKMLSWRGRPPEQAKKDAEPSWRSRRSWRRLRWASPICAIRRRPITCSRSRRLKRRYRGWTSRVSGCDPLATGDARSTTPRRSSFPALMKAADAADMETLKAYMRYHLLTALGRTAAQAFDEENFDFYGRKLNGQPEQSGALEALLERGERRAGRGAGQGLRRAVFRGRQQGEDGARWCSDIESAMDRDIDQLDWMSPATKARAKEKLHACRQQDRLSG